MPRPYYILKLIFPLLILGALIFFADFAPARMVRNAVWALVRPIAGIVTAAPGKIAEEQGAETNGRLAAALFEIEELRLRMKELEKALRFKEESRLPLEGARVVFHLKELGQEYLLIDRGGKDGVREGDLALASNRVMVGRVYEVEDSFSKVSLASNPGETFEAEILPLRVSVLAKGLGARTFSLGLIPADAPIKQGDFVALAVGGTSIVLGEIVQEKRSVNSAFKEAGAILLAKPELLKEIFILQRPPSP